MLFFSLLLVCYYLLFFLFVWYFNIIARSALLLLFFSRACFCFLVVMYAIVFAPCSVNAERQKQHSGQRISEQRQGNARRACPALPDCLCCRCIIYHYARTYAAGVYRPAPGGTFSVRFTGKNQPNRSCSSSQPIVRKAIHSLPR